MRLDGVRLRSRRVELGMSQDDLARRAGVALRTVKNAEAGRGLAPFTARCLAVALDLAYATVVRGSASPAPERVHAPPTSGPLTEGDAAGLFQWARATRPPSDGPDGADLLAAVQADLPRWCAVFDAAAASVLHVRTTSPIARPEELPPLRTAIGLDAATWLHDPLLLVIVRLFGPPRSPAWIAAGLALARAQGNVEAFASLSALYGWWWFARRGAVEMGRAWTTYACEAMSGEPRRKAEYGLHAALFAWLARGNREAARMREDALRIAREADVGWQVGVSARVAAATSRAMLGDPRGARALLREAPALVPDGSEGQKRVARAVVDLDLAACARLLDDLPVPPGRVKHALGIVHGFVCNYPILVYKLGLLARWLGVEAPWEPMTTRQAVGSIAPRFVVDQLAMLVQLCAEHRIAFPGVHREPAAVATLHGPLSRIGLTVSAATSRGFDLQLDILCPVGGTASLLDREHARYALDAIGTGCAADHPLLDVLAGLAEGASPA